MQDIENGVTPVGLELMINTLKCQHANPQFELCFVLAL